MNAAVTQQDVIGVPLVLAASERLLLLANRGAESDGVLGGTRFLVNAA